MIRRLSRALPFVAAAAILAASFGSGIDGVKFHVDESFWIGTSYYLEALLGRQIDELPPSVPRPLWGDSYELITQPSLARYVIGVGRRAGGYDVTELNNKWNYDAVDSVNVAEGRMPSERLLRWSRLPMAALTAATGLLLFGVAWRIAGPVGASVFLLLYAFNPLLLVSMRRAMGDATLVFLSILAILATDRGVRALSQTGGGAHPARAGRSSAFWWVAAGVACGLAGAAKLNGLLAASGVVLAAWVAIHRGPEGVSPLARRRAAIAALGLVLVSTAIAFVAPNPYLYPNPVWRTMRMWRNRASEMRGQMESFPTARLDGVADRAQAAVHRVFDLHATIRFPGAWVVLGAFTLAGFLVLLARARRSLAAGRPGTEYVLLIVGATLVVPALMTPLDWDRYYLFPVVFANLCLAVGVAAAVDRVRSRSSHSPGANHARIPLPT